MREHWLNMGTYTNPGLYGDYFKTLPDDIASLGKIVCDQVVHPTVLMFPNPVLEGYFGPFADYPWDRTKSEDEIFVTAPAMVAELFRRDPRGFVAGKPAAKRLAVTCRHASVLMASIGKAKGIPTRCRAGFIDFTHGGGNFGDHWINQIWNGNRWQNVDASGYYGYEERFGFSQFDLPGEKFLFAADAWLGIRRGQLEGNCVLYQDARGTHGLDAAILVLLYDFHALMHNEVFYSFRPKALSGGIGNLGDRMMDKLDDLARALQDPDGNWDRLTAIWREEKAFRILTSPFNEDF